MVAPAVAQAAMDSGVATRPIADMEAYVHQLSDFVYSTGLLMRPVFVAAKKNPARVVFCEGEDERVLRAVQTVCDESLARPILIGRPEVVERSITRHGLRIRAGEHFELISPDSDPRYKELWQDYHGLMSRKGVSVEYAKLEMRKRTTLIGAMLVRHNYADAMICGTYGKHSLHLRYIDRVIGRKAGDRAFLRHEHADPAAPDLVHRRYLCQLRPDGRTARGDDPARRRRGGAALV